VYTNVRITRTSASIISKNTYLSSSFPVPDAQSLTHIERVAQGVS
jgi:hypothetical protein